MPAQPLCCGLTWISTGQLATARRVLQRTVDALAPYLQRGTKIVGLEPSCTAVFRSDARELMPGDRDVQRLREQTVTLAELLQRPHRRLAAAAASAARRSRRPTATSTPSWATTRTGRCCATPASTSTCWTPAAAGWPATSASKPATTTCRVACGERVLLPAVRDAAPATLMLADGFSCRTQIEQGGTGRTPVHLAEVLAAGLRNQPVQPARPASPARSDYLRLAGLAPLAWAPPLPRSAPARRRR